MVSSRKKRKSKYGSLADKARRKAEKDSRGFNVTHLNLPQGAQLFNLKDKKSAEIDILPYVAGKGNPDADAGELYYERTYYVHKNIGVDKGWYVCPKKTAGKRCPICDFAARLEDDDDELKVALKPKRHQLFNVVDKKDSSGKVQIFDISHYLFGERLSAELLNAEDDDSILQFADLQGGSSLKLGISDESFEGRGFKKVTSIRFKSREDYDDNIIDEVYNLDELLNILPYDELKKIFMEASLKDDEDEASNKKGKTMAKKKKESKKKKKVEDFEEEEEELDEDEDEDEDDEDDEDEDDDDEDEDDDDDDDDDDEDEDDDDDDEDEDDDDEDEDDDDDEDEDDEDEDEDDEDEDDDDEDEDDDDEDEKPSKRSSKKSVKKKTTKKVTKKKAGKKKK